MYKRQQLRGQSIDVAATTAVVSVEDSDFSLCEGLYQGELTYQVWNQPDKKDKVIRGASGPVAVETSFGFTLSGGIPPLKIRSQPHLNLMMTCLKTAAVSNSLESKLMKFWTCEGLGVESDSVDVVDAQIDESIVFEKGKYFIDLPKSCLLYTSPSPRD